MDKQYLAISSLRNIFSLISKKFLTCHTMEKTFFPNYNKGCYLRGNFFDEQEKLSRKKKSLYQFQTSAIGNCMSNIETIFFVGNTYIFCQKHDLFWMGVFLQYIFFDRLQMFIINKILFTSNKNILPEIFKLVTSFFSSNIEIYLLFFLLDWHLQQIFFCRNR